MGGFVLSPTQKTDDALHPTKQHSRVRRTRALLSALVDTKVMVSRPGAASTLAPGARGASSVVSTPVAPENECTSTLPRKAASLAVL